MSENQDVVEQNEESAKSQPSEELKEALKPEKSPEQLKAEAHRAECEAEHKRQEALKDRFSKLKNPRMAGQQLNMADASLVFDQRILFNPDHAKALEMMAELEAMDHKIHVDMSNQENKQKRKLEYSKIDQLLLEALAEREEGNKAKMKEYLAKRKAVRDSLPLLK